MKSSLSYKIYPKTTIKRIEKKVKLLGVSTDFSVVFFLNGRLLLCILVFILLFMSQEVLIYR